MKRYHYRPVEQARPSRQRWLVPAACVVLAVGVVGFASIGASLERTETTSNPSVVALSSSLPSDTVEVARIAQPSAAAPPGIEREFGPCGAVRRTCVVDGDTFWLDGQKIRIADIDTPEVSQPQCAAEKALGDRATDRLTDLLNQGPFELTSIGDRDEDQHGRKLRVVVRDGRSLGNQLVSEGLARTWTGRREPWC